MAAEFLDVYRQYIQRFEEKFGALAFDEPVRHSGYLIAKLRYEDFSTHWNECLQLESLLRDVASQNLTINDEVKRQYLDACAKVLKNPKDFNMM